MRETGGLTLTKNVPSRLWTSDFILICVCTFVYFTAVRFLDTTNTLYAKFIGAGNSYGGSMATMFVLGSIIMAMFAGPIIERFGRRRILVVAALAYAFVTVPCLFMTNKAILLVIRVLHGASKALFIIAAYTVASDILPKSRMGEGMGYFGLGTTLSQAMGPTIALWLVTGDRYDRVFSSVILLIVISAVLSAFIRYEKKTPELVEKARITMREENRRTSEARGFDRYFERNAIPASVANFLLGGGMTCVLVFLTIHAEEEMPQFNAGVYFIISAIPMLLTRMFAGKVMDKRGAVGLLMVSFITGIASHLLLMADCYGSYAVFLLSGALNGTMTGLATPILSAVAVVDSPADRKATANATFNFSQDFGILPVSFFGGIIADHFGYNAMYMLGNICLVLAAIVTLVFLNNRSRARRRERAGIDLS